jgi:hypothetical protein
VGTVAAVFAIVQTGLVAQGPPADSMRLAAEHAPLFASHEIINVTIEGPLETIFQERGQDSEYHDAILWYEDENGERVTLDLGVKTRGNFRLQEHICDFPNVRLNFKRSQVPGTLFDGQDRVPIVAHCQDREEYQQYAIQEYLIYRTFNQLSDASVRVRLARFTWIDTEGDRDTVTKYGFFLEHFDNMATRHGWEVLEVPIVPPEQHDQHQLMLFEVFQFMIGNTDWDPFSAEEGEFCCHNAVLIGTMMGPVMPVPYDFDWSGLIYAPYAEPNPMLGIRSVRERRYWGVCRPASDFTSVFALFNEKRDAIYDLWRNQEGLTERTLRESLEYFDEFYEIINDSRRVERQILRRCRGG